MPVETLRGSTIFLHLQTIERWKMGHFNFHFKIVNQPKIDIGWVLKPQEILFQRFHLIHFQISSHVGESDTFLFAGVRM